jgi:hypothetical protein
MTDLWLFEALEGLWHLLIGDRHSSRAERTLKAHQVRRVAEIKAERGQF